MILVRISGDAIDDLNDGFRFYEAQEPGLGDYFLSQLRADIDGLMITAGIWTDCFHAGDSFVIYDLETTGLYHGVKSRLGLRDTAMRRHDARGDVDLLGRAIEEMSRRLSLDASFNGVPRHARLLPHV
jgi:hypothetical protein